MVLSAFNHAMDQLSFSNAYPAIHSIYIHGQVMYQQQHISSQWGFAFIVHPIQYHYFKNRYMHVAIRLWCKFKIYYGEYVMKLIENANVRLFTTIK